MKIKKRKGFTLIEILISMAITFALIGTTTSFMYYFSRTSNRNIILNDMNQELRVLSNRIEKEMLPASKILYTYTYTDTSGSHTVTTGKSTVIMQVPVLNSQGFYVTDTEGIPVMDTAVIYITNDGDKLKLRPASATLNRVKFVLRRSPFSNRTNDFSDEILYSKLMPVDTTTKLYSYPAIITGGDTVGVFTYYKLDGTEFSPASQADTTLISTIRVTLWSEREYSNFQLARKQTVDITIRNFEGK
jgi:type II secretory pathway pseudopilin PulG